MHRLPVFVKNSVRPGSICKKSGLSRKVDIFLMQICGEEGGKLERALTKQQHCGYIQRFFLYGLVALHCLIVSLQS